MLTYAEAMNCPQTGIEVVGTPLPATVAIDAHGCAVYCNTQEPCITWTYFKNDEKNNCHTFLSTAGYKENPNACSGEWDCTDPTINDLCA